MKSTLQEARLHYPDHFTFLVRASQIHGQREEWTAAMEALNLYFEKVALYKAGKILTHEVLVDGLNSETESKLNMAIICFKLDQHAACCHWLLEAYRAGSEAPAMQALASMSGKLGMKQVLPLLDEMIRCRKSRPLKELLVEICRQLTQADMEYLRRFVAELKAWPA